MWKIKLDGANFVPERFRNLEIYTDLPLVSRKRIADEKKIRIILEGVILLVSFDVMA